MSVKTLTIKSIFGRYKVLFDEQLSGGDDLPSHIEVFKEAAEVLLMHTERSELAKYTLGLRSLSEVYLLLPHFLIEPTSAEGLEKKVVS